MFAIVLCVLLNATACRPDTNGRSMASWTTPASQPQVHKETLSGCDLAYTAPPGFPADHPLSVHKARLLDDGVVGKLQARFAKEWGIAEAQGRTAGIFLADHHTRSHHPLAGCGADPVPASVQNGVQLRPFGVDFGTTHHLFVVKDPVQNLISLSRKTFCHNSGGFARKFRNLDAIMFDLLAANTGAGGTGNPRRAPPFHALVYIDDLYEPTRFRELLRRTGLLAHLAVPDQSDLLEAFTTGHDELIADWEANDPRAKHQTTTEAPHFKHETKISMALNWKMKLAGINTKGMAFGNFNGGYPRHSPSPEYCQAVLLAYWHMPVTFRHFHPARADLIVEWLALSVGGADGLDGARTYPFDHVHDSADEATAKLRVQLECVGEPLGPGIKRAGACAAPQFYWDVGVYEKCWEGCVCCL